MWVGEFLHSPQIFAYAKKHVNTAKERRKFSPACWGKKIPQKLPNSFPKLGKKYDKIRCFVSLILDTKKPLKTLNFQGFMLNFNQILFLSCCCLLSCNFCCKIFFFLFDTFANFVSNHWSNLHIFANFLCNFCNIFSNC